MYYPDLPNPKLCQSGVFKKKPPKIWRLGPQTWRFLKQVSNKTKKGDCFHHGILYLLDIIYSKSFKCFAIFGCGQLLVFFSLEAEETPSQFEILFHYPR